MEKILKSAVSNKLYLYLDGDGIGDRLELLLLDGKLKEARQLSESIQKSIETICKLLNSLPDACLIFSGGDDVVFALNENSWDARIAHQIQEEFQSTTGCSLSGGVGNSIQVALMNLRRAKLSGKSRIIFNEK